MLDLGCNDLNRHEEVNPLFLAAYIVEAAECLLTHGVRHVIIAAMQRRAGRGALSRNMPARADIQAAEGQFNERVDEYNARVKLLIRDRPTISYLQQKGMVVNWRSNLGPDGVHLKFEALQFYAANMKKAIIRAGKKVLGEDERQVNTIIW